MDRELLKKDLEFLRTDEQTSRTEKILIGLTLEIDKIRKRLDKLETDGVNSK